MAYVVMAYTIMAYTVMACVVMVYTLMAYVVMAGVVMACFLMACVVMASYDLCSCLGSYISWYQAYKRHCLEKFMSNVTMCTLTSARNISVY